MIVVVLGSTINKQPISTSSDTTISDVAGSDVVESDTAESDTAESDIVESGVTISSIVESACYYNAPPMAVLEVDNEAKCYQYIEPIYTIKPEKPAANPTEEQYTPTKQVGTQYAPTFKYDDYDIRCLAVAMYREAGGERGEGAELCQLLVGNVIINRAMYKGDFPNTIQDVLRQPHQYPWVNRVGFHWSSNVSKEERTYFCNLAKRLLNGERVCPYNVTFQAEFKMQRHGNPADAKVFKYFGFKKKNGRISKYYFCYY